MTEIIETIWSLAQFEIGDNQTGATFFSFPTDHRCRLFGGVIVFFFVATNVAIKRH
jgi:hypothetical protein